MARACCLPACAACACLRHRWCAARLWHRPCQLPTRVHNGSTLLRPSRLLLQIRALKTSPDSLVLLRTNMGAGHFAQSGLEDRLAETAFK